LKIACYIWLRFFQWLVPLPSRLGGPGERRELPQRSPGQSLGRQLTHSRHVSGPQKPSSENNALYGVYGIVKCEKLLANVIYMEIFSVQKGGPPKIDSPVWLNMPKAGPDSVQQSSCPLLNFTSQI